MQLHHIVGLARAQVAFKMRDNISSIAIPQIFILNTIKPLTSFHILACPYFGMCHCGTKIVCFQDYKLWTIALKQFEANKYLFSMNVNMSTRPIIVWTLGIIRYARTLCKYFCSIHSYLVVTTDLQNEVIQNIVKS